MKITPAISEFIIKNRPDLSYVKIAVAIKDKFSISISSSTVSYYMEKIDAQSDPELANNCNHTKTRVCLKCGQNFKSSWAGNRLCENCKYQRQMSAYELSPETEA